MTQGNRGWKNNQFALPEREQLRTINMRPHVNMDQVTTIAKDGGLQQRLSGPMTGNKSMSSTYKEGFVTNKHFSARPPEL